MTAPTRCASSAPPSSSSTPPRSRMRRPLSLRRHRRRHPRLRGAARPARPQRAAARLRRAAAARSSCSTTSTSSSTAASCRTPRPWRGRTAASPIPPRPSRCCSRAPAAQRPNRITAADFDGWVAGARPLLPRHARRRYTRCSPWPIPASRRCAAPRRRAPRRGWYVYTGLALFRQLPEGVPGAYRLLANLVSLGVAAVRTALPSRPHPCGTAAPAR
jgi:hypothetical protein